MDSPVHADATELLTWLQALPVAPETIYIIHSEPQSGPLPGRISGPVSYGRGAVLPGAWSSPAAALDMARTGIGTVFFVDARAGTRKNRPTAAPGWSFIASNPQISNPRSSMAGLGPRADTRARDHSGRGPANRLTAIADDLTVDTPVESSWDFAILVVVTMTLQPNEGLSRPVTWPT